MFHRVLWFKRAKRTWGKEKSVHGVNRITRLMQEIRDTRRKAPSTKQTPLNPTPSDYFYLERYL